MMIIDNKFNIGDIVYLVTDPEQTPRMITAIWVYASGNLRYELSYSEHSTSHYECEITPERNVLASIGV